MTGTLTLFAAADDELVKIGGAVVHWLHGDDGNCTVAGKGRKEPRARKYGNQPTNYQSVLMSLQIDLYPSER